MLFDSLVIQEEKLKKVWTTYYLTLNGKYFKITQFTAMDILSTFETDKMPPKTEGNITTTIYYQR